MLEVGLDRRIQDLWGMDGGRVGSVAMNIELGGFDIHCRVGEEKDTNGAVCYIIHPSRSGLSESYLIIAPIQHPIIMLIEYIHSNIPSHPQFNCFPLAHQVSPNSRPDSALQFRTRWPEAKRIPVY